MNYLPGQHGFDTAMYAQIDSPWSVTGTGMRSAVYDCLVRACVRACNCCHEQTLENVRAAAVNVSAHLLKLAHKGQHRTDVCDCVVVSVTSTTSRRWTTFERPPLSTICRSPSRSTPRDRKYAPESWLRSVAVTVLYRYRSSYRSF